MFLSSNREGSEIFVTLILLVVVEPGMCWKKNLWVGATFFSAHPRPPMKFSFGWAPNL